MRVDDLCRELAEALLETHAGLQQFGNVSTEQQEQLCAWLTVAIRQAVEQEADHAVQQVRRPEGR